MSTEKEPESKDQYAVLEDPYAFWEPSMDEEEFRRVHFPDEDEQQCEAWAMQVLREEAGKRWNVLPHECPKGMERCPVDHEELEEMRPMYENSVNVQAENQNPRVEFYSGRLVRREVKAVLNVDAEGFERTKDGAYDHLHGTGYIRAVYNGPANLVSYRRLFTTELEEGLRVWLVENHEGNHMEEVREDIEDEVVEYVRVHTLNAVFSGELGQGVYSIGFDVPDHAMGGMW